MEDPKDGAKAAKKAAKAEAKRLKKLAKENEPAPSEGTRHAGVSPPSTAASTPLASVSPDTAPPVGQAMSSPPTATAPTPLYSDRTPAERAAAAAERQVELHRYRMWLAAAMVLISLVAFFVSVKPWTLLRSSAPSPTATSPTEEGGN